MHVSRLAQLMCLYKYRGLAGPHGLLFPPKCQLPATAGAQACRSCSKPETRPFSGTPSCPRSLPLSSPLLYPGTQLWDSLPPPRQMWGEDTQTYKESRTEGSVTYTPLMTPCQRSAANQRTYTTHALVPSWSPAGPQSSIADAHLPTTELKEGQIISITPPLYNFQNPVTHQQYPSMVTTIPQAQNRTEQHSSTLEAVKYFLPGLGCCWWWERDLTTLQGSWCSLVLSPTLPATLHLPRPCVGQGKWALGTDSTPSN